jgi:hypothetical protein
MRRPSGVQSTLLHGVATQHMIPDTGIADTRAPVPRFVVMERASIGSDSRAHPVRRDRSRQSLGSRCADVVAGAPLPHLRCASAS